MSNNNFVKICLKNGVKDLFETPEAEVEDLFEVPARGIEYSVDREAYIDKSKLVWFKVDEVKMTIAMSFGDAWSTLQFPDHSGEFQRVKSELTSQS
ncbi:hypothetical protein [Photobacterium sp.]|uniref:hypothetical protein n=1 Tax=Photobacterium sp. TaxID=660 RepID=UPI00299E801A|nr:hypothetical protein [Photobacterium sp.]MDX1304372.1 hypothetical protein [Photobacterium sp.]